MKLLTYKNINFFQSDLLKENNFKHAFFTKRSKKNDPIELQNQLSQNSNIHYLNQIHSDKVIQVNNSSNFKAKTGDSLITKEKGQSLWIYTADCIPVLIADIKTGNIAACHTGLEGLKKQIIPKTLKRLEGIGSNKKNLIIAIGPSIKGDKYQVKKTDIEDLIFLIKGECFLEKSFIMVNSNKEEELIPFFNRDQNTDKIFFDIQSAAILQLYKEGIKRYQINRNRLCTYSNPKLFNSYRRDKTNSRQWSCIYS